ncbi:peptidase C1 [candidate division KSB1 bacterium]|nr:peptidase C1 [candidate division KSB1 bacterium]
MIRIMRLWLILLLPLWLMTSIAHAQTRGDMTFYEATTTYSGEQDTVLTFDASMVKRPASVESFNPPFHFQPIRQDTTGTCWAFASISFLESELARLGKGQIDLSEIFVVYYEYLEKARRFVQRRGNSGFMQGSEENATLLRIKQYGIVRAQDYTGLLEGQRFHSHDAMFDRMNAYLQFVKKQQLWNEDVVLSQIKMILNAHLGEPPATILINGRNVTPLEYATEILTIPVDDYVDLMSFKYAPFYTQAEYKVPDNWWHCKDYYNVPLDEWYKALVNAMKNGYTVAIGGDVTEIGKQGDKDIAIIPPFDIEPDRIDQDAREYRFNNQTSTDDHLLHVLGYQRYSVHDWFLIKDSGYSATQGKFKGYYFFRGDYIKLKMLTFLVHKDAVTDLLRKF